MRLSRGTKIFYKGPAFEEVGWTEGVVITPGFDVVSPRAQSSPKGRLAGYHIEIVGSKAKAFVYAGMRAIKVRQ